MKGFYVKKGNMWRNLSVRILLAGALLLAFLMVSGMVVKAEGENAVVEVTYVNGDITEYETFDEATTNLDGVVSIVLLKNVESPHQVVIPKGTDITLDLNNCGITRTAGEGIFLVKGKLTLTDSRVINGEAKVVDSICVGADHLAQFGDDASFKPCLIVEGGYITGGGGTACGGAVAVDGGTFIMEAGTIFGCKAEGDKTPFGEMDDPAFYPGGGAVYVNSGEFIMKGGELFGNKADTDSERSAGGAIGMKEGSITIDDAIVSSNYCSGYGGGIYIAGKADIHNNAYVIRNEAECGGAIYAALLSDTSLSEAYLFDNEAVAGGAIYAAGILSITDGNITDNKAQYGGAIYTQSLAEGDCTLYINGETEILQNTDETHGGVVITENTELHLKGRVSIWNNVAGSTNSNLCLLGKNYIFFDGEVKKRYGLGLNPRNVDLSSGYGEIITMGWSEYMKDKDPNTLFTLENGNYKLKTGSRNEVYLLDANTEYRNVSFVEYSGEEPIQDYMIAESVKTMLLPGMEMIGRIHTGWTVDGKDKVYGIGEEYTFESVQDITFAAASEEGYITMYEPLDGKIPATWSQDGDEGWVAIGGYVCHYGEADTQSRLITEPIDLTGAQAAVLMFYYTNSDDGEHADTLDVSYRVDGGEWSEPILTITEPSEGWYYHSVELPEEAFTSKVELGFQATSKEKQTISLFGVLVNIPGHYWEIELAESGDEILASCVNAPHCDSGGKASVSIRAPKMTAYMDGKSPLATLEDLDAFNKLTGLELTEDYIWYSDAEGNELEQAPTGPGTYMANITIGGETDSVTASVEYTITASYEWVDGVWYNKDGTQTYKYTAKWKKTEKGKTYVDEAGRSPKNCWRRIDGKWYYFDKAGCVETNCYRKGWYLSKDGSWDGKEQGSGWVETEKGWKYAGSSKNFLKNTWMMIDGKWYYFHADGTAAENEFVGGYWLRKDSCFWDGGKKSTWHKFNAKTWWYGSDEWYAHGKTYKIDGTEYRFDRNGYWVEK